MARSSNLRADLIEAGLEVLRTESLEALSLRHVAGMTGVSHAAAYRHFQNKDDLLAAIAEEGFGLFYQYQLDGLEAQGLILESGQFKKTSAAIADRIRHLGWTYVHFVIEHPGYARIMFAGHGLDFRMYPRLQAGSARTYRLLQNSIRDGQQQGLIAAGRTREKTLAAWSMVHGVAMLILDGRLKQKSNARETRRQIESIIEYVFSGMQA